MRIAGFVNQPNLLVEGLFIAGAARLQYTRTAALIIHEVLIELNLTDWRVMHAVRVYLYNFATSSLLRAFHNCSSDFKLFETNNSMQQLYLAILLDATELGDMLSCDICAHLMHSPYLLSECGHCYCEGCLKGWFDETLTKHIRAHATYDANRKLVPPKFSSSSSKVLVLTSHIRFICNCRQCAARVYLPGMLAGDHEKTSCKFCS
ncbi:hypothetical protein P692DRAFT_20132702 [Suillus brevipes Sb2]|nr:hypothetical protein P692DRAFT_20132702 [Suillus brevipes Sb2]